MEMEMAIIFECSIGSFPFTYLDVATHNKVYGGSLMLPRMTRLLLMKHLHNFFNGHNLTWVQPIWNTYYSSGPPTVRYVGSFSWKAILKFLPKFKEIATCTVGQGTSAMFWHDNWDNGPLKIQFPELFSFVVSCSVSMK